MESHVFELETVDLAGTAETVLRGGAHLYPLLPKAFNGVKRIGVIGWGPQGRAQAQNLRDSLAGSDIEVTVGLRKGSPSWAEAEELGFAVDEVLPTVAASDLVMLLIADAALAALYPEIFAAVKPGATIGLSHGFLVGWLGERGDDFPDNVSVIGMCPKGMGASVRRLYEDGSGINASIAVHRDLDGHSTDRALAWAVGVGSPYVFETTLVSEYKSDIFGERGILLGATHGIVEALFRRAGELGDGPEQAFLRSTESLTGTLARAISHNGIKGAVEHFEGDARRTFEDAYCATYPTAAGILAEIYDDVSSGSELRSVVNRGKRLTEHPMSPIDGTRMWQVGSKVRDARSEKGDEPEIDPFTAGVFLATMVAQVDLLADRGHPWSEIANESVIEAVDSLIPYMHARGVAYMVDNCSVTARLGSRKWGPRFQAGLEQEVFPAVDAEGRRDDALVKSFWDHPVHDVLATLLEYRPPVDIAVK
jgi:ketol-acid reductoisomerase